MQFNTTKIRKSTFPFFILIFISVCSLGQISDKKFDEIINQCSDINSGDFRCKPYIELAVYLQTLDKKQAFLLLKENAQSQKFEDQIIIITRMLFQAKTDSLLRRPYIGGASFFGGTDYKNWSTEPIVIVEGVPFLITRGYSLGGVPETSLSYLNYCFKNGEWTSVTYSIKSDEVLKNALYTFLSSNKWKSKLSSFDKAFFENQISQ